jgi:Ca-activated chloride channel family protein
MNHDKKNPDLQPWIEPELEARIVAAVLGEASAFETAELERLTSEKPELAIFKRRIEAVHGLVGAAARPEQAPLRLAPERRAKILQTIGATAARAPGADANAPILVQLDAVRKRRRQRHRKIWIWATSLAASLMFAAILALNQSHGIFGSAQLSSEKIAQAEREKTFLASDERGRQLMELPPAPAATISSQPTRGVVNSTVNEEAVILSPFEVTKKPSIVTSLRKALTTAPESASTAADNAPNGNAKLPKGNRRYGFEPLAPSVFEQNNHRDSLDLSAAKLNDPGKRSLQGQLVNDRETAPRISTSQARSDSDEMRQQVAQQKAPRSVATGSFLEAGKEEITFGGTVAGLAGIGSSAGIAGGIIDRKIIDSRTEGAGGRAAAEKKVFYYDAPVATAAPAFEGSEKVAGNNMVTLSPFTVSASSEGSAAALSIAGTRLNSKLNDSWSSADSDHFKTKIADLAASISVVSKQQMADASSVDVNDRFKDDSFLSGPADKPAKITAQLTASDRPETDANALSAAEEDRRLSQQAASSPVPSEPTDSLRAEVSAARESVSTFSLHVSDVSFRLAQAALARGEMPDPERIRPEEFYNAFDYGDPSPATSDKISCHIEQSAHPLLQQRNLVRIAMKVPAAGRGAGQPLHLTVLLDTSGSMEREDRVASVHRALEVLASLLGANDRVMLIGFARQPRLLVENLSGDQASRLVSLAEHTPFTGGTNLEEALKLAGELARRHQDAMAQNRIVLLTDGAANLGNADPAQLAAMIEALRQQGLAFDACGVGADGLDDTILEALTRKGDGRYYVLDSAADADAGFARQLAGAFRPAAENVKVQVRFNPARVGRYRLIGFEQHRLREEDFRNDKVDAAELAAEEAAVALYQVEVLPQGEGELGEVFVRFRDPATSTMVERSWTMLYEPKASAFDRATPTMQLAGTAALLAEKLRGGEQAAAIQLGTLAPVVNALRGHYANDARVQELATMFEQVRRAEGK